MDLHVSRLGVDLMTLNSGKIYGPKQFGCLYVGRKVELLPVILGGGQERGFRSGTENPSNIIGFAKALSLVQENKTDELKRLSVLRDYFISQLIDKFPTVLINGSVEKRLPNNIHATFPGKDNEELLMRLDELGILCASGSACSASNEEVSVVLTAIGLSEVDARSSLRFTLGKFTTKKDLDYVIGSLIKIL
jgi:cysteine desulfurase